MKADREDRQVEAERREKFKGGEGTLDCVECCWDVENCEDRGIIFGFSNIEVTAALVKCRL